MRLCYVLYGVYDLLLYDMPSSRVTYVAETKTFSRAANSPRPNLTGSAKAVGERLRDSFRAGRKTAGGKAGISTGDGEETFCATLEGRFCCTLIGQRP